MLFFLLVLNLVQASQTFRADGWATSSVAEYLAFDDARSALWSDARSHCQEGNSPAYVEHSGLCQASYQNHLWRAHCYGDFVCLATLQSSPDYGPWRNEEGTSAFYFVPGKMSWWKAEEACAQLRARLVSLESLRSNFVYLNGTSPMGDHLKALEHGGYPEIWTGDVELKQQAWAFNPDFPGDPRTFRQDFKLAVVCSRSIVNIIR
ncbi:MAG: C-type lectin domain-containing protein [Deltaproteobacteria bacterium]|nr:C-type lectin domain-containing protein [Deltaproteobacteria bacterium]